MDTVPRMLLCIINQHLAEPSCSYIETGLYGHQKQHQMIYNMMLIINTPEVADMRTTVNIDDELLADAQRATGVTERATLLREGLKALIERESARRLAQLGATEKQLKPVPRRRLAGK
jgi:Arc/MetJ family transcription regulator